MLHPIQALLWILFLQYCAVAVSGTRIIGSPVFRALEVSRKLPALPETNLGDLPAKTTNDKFDAFQEPFTDGITSFDDDFKEYVDDGFVEGELGSPLALDSRILEQLAPKKPSRGSERIAQEHDALTERPFDNIPTAEAKPAETELPITEAEPAQPSITEAEAELKQAPTKVESALGESDMGTKLVATEVEPTRTESVSEGRGPGLFNQICRSREFQPTLENWWISGADRWLKNYTVENRNSPAFRAFGLVGSIAKKYLRATDFECKIVPGEVFRPETCRVSCVDIVERVDNIEEARGVFFVLSGVVGLTERVGGIYNAIGQVPQDVARLVEKMPTKAGLNTPADAISGTLFNSIDSTLFASSPWIPTANVHQSGNEALRAAKHFYDMAVQVSTLTAGRADPYKWDKIFDSSYEMALDEIDFAPKGYASGTTPISEGMEEGTWYSKAVVRTRRELEDARALVAVLENGDLVEARNEGFELFKELFAYNPSHPRRAMVQDSAPGIETILDNAADKARTMLADEPQISPNFFATDIIFPLALRSPFPTSGKPTLQSKFTPEIKSSPGINICFLRRTIARDVFMELFDNSLRQQPVYISCTEDKQQRANPRSEAVGPRVDTCNRDNTGPQNLKACFGNMVCYLYEWNERSMSHMSRNREPEGHRNWDEKPWSIEPQDIIISSVATHFSKDFVPKDIAEEADFYYETARLDSLSDPRAADHFKIPVCMSTHNWNTRLDGWNTFCDTSKHCTAKNLPCQCGPSGRDTQSLWEEVGIWNSPERDYYSATLCPRQIQKKISDPLERYIAYCYLGIKRRGCGGNRVNGPRRYQGRDRYCDVITKTVESQKNGLVSDLDPETRFMFLCQIQNGGRGCNMYQKSFEELQAAAHVGEDAIELVQEVVHIGGGLVELAQE